MPDDKNTIEAGRRRPSGPQNLLVDVGLIVDVLDGSSNAVFVQARVQSLV